jgi:hypothetical protein
MRLIGGEIYELENDKIFKVSRLTSKNANSNYITDLKINCLDTPSKKILLETTKDHFIDNTEKLSARSFATLVIEPELNLEQQEKLKQDFNEFLNEKRAKYNSLFLSGYRENDRKRISFGLVFKIVEHLLSVKK